MGLRESDTNTFQGRQLRNFGAHSGFLYFQLLTRRRRRQQQAVRAQVRTGVCMYVSPARLAVLYVRMYGRYYYSVRTPLQS